MNRTRAKPAWLTPSVRRHIRRAAYEFHIRAFGEEMARLNFLPLEERKAHVRAMADHARAKGIKFEKPPLGVTPYRVHTPGVMSPNPVLNGSHCRISVHAPKKNRFRFTWLSQ